MSTRTPFTVEELIDLLRMLKQFIDAESRYKEANIAAITLFNEVQGIALDRGASHLQEKLDEVRK